MDGRKKPKNHVKSQLFWPGTEGRRDTALNLSDTALFGQGIQGQRDRPRFFAYLQFLVILHEVQSPKIM